MKGIEATKQLVADHLAAHIPDVLDDLADDVDPPKSYRLWGDQQHIAADMPVIEIVALTTPTVRPLDITDQGAPLVEISYRLRMFLWVRGDNFEQTTHRRDVLTTALLMVPLTWVQLDPAAKFDTTTITSALSDVVQDDRSPASIAAAYVEALVKVEETVDIDPLATADDIQVVVHPAL